MDNEVKRVSKLEIQDDNENDDKQSKIIVNQEQTPDNVSSDFYNQFQVVRNVNFTKKRSPLPSQRDLLSWGEIGVEGSR